VDTNVNYKAEMITYDFSPFTDQAKIKTNKEPQQETNPMKKFNKHGDIGFKMFHVVGRKLFQLRGKINTAVFLKAICNRT